MKNLLTSNVGRVQENLQTINGGRVNMSPLTMSHLEIATLAEKRTDNVKRTIEALVTQGVIVAPQIEEQQIPRGNKGGYQTVKAYMINQRDSYVVMAQVNAAFTGKLVDRWMELEAAQPKQPAIPTNFAEALQLAADQAKQLELAAPKVAFVDNLVDRGEGLMTATAVAQKHGRSAMWLNKILSEHGFYNKCIKSRSKIFRQWVLDKGLGKMKQNDNGYSQSLFTNKGEVFVHNLLKDEGII